MAAVALVGALQIARGGRTRGQHLARGASERRQVFAAGAAAGQGGEHDRAEHGGVGTRRQLHRAAQHIRVELRPQRAGAATAGQQEALGGDAERGEPLDDVAAREGRALEDGAGEVATAVLAREAKEGAALSASDRCAIEQWISAGAPAPSATSPSQPESQP